MGTLNNLLNEHTMQEMNHACMVYKQPDRNNNCETGKKRLAKKTSATQTQPSAALTAEAFPTH